MGSWYMTIKDNMKELGIKIDVMAKVMNVTQMEIHTTATLMLEKLEEKAFLPGQMVKYMTENGRQV